MILQALLAPRNLRLECIHGLDLRAGWSGLDFLCGVGRQDTLFIGTGFLYAAAELFDTIDYGKACVR